MAQFTSSKTTGGGVIVNTVLDTVSNTVTYTATAPNGAVATATQNASGGVDTATAASIRQQLAQGGADAATFQIGLLTALSSTTSNTNDQAATAPPAVQETQSIPVSTVSDAAVPQPTNQDQPASTYTPTPVVLTDEQRAQLAETNERIAAKEPNTVATTTTTAAPAATPTTAPAAFDPNQDEFGNLGAAQAAAAERTENPSPEAVQAGLDDAFANMTPTPDEPPGAYDAKSLGIEEDSWLSQKYGEVKQFINRQTLKSEDALNAASQSATILKAKEQATLAARYRTPSNGDWRVRLVLAEGATYLYKDPQVASGILKPLADSNGVIFPYTPQIQTSYSANYDKYDLTHSNYRGYFYKSSAVGEITINATFTAQDTAEAQYMLAVIHFFRSATKMFYGQDPLRGAPPPMMYLVGLGEFQFNGHPCVISNFQYNLPNDVDYIRATNPNNYGTNLLNRVTPISSASSILPPSINRLSNAIDKFGKFLKPGALPGLPQTNGTPGVVTNANTSTYVPTKIELNITLLPIQTRAQVSKQFKNSDFANGSLLKGGFW